MLIFACTLSVLIFACIYFHELKKSYFASTGCSEWQVFENFKSTYFCEWLVFENFEFINFRPKENRIRKRQLTQGTFGCFCQDRRKVKQVTMEKLLLIHYKKSWTNQNFLCIFFFVFIFTKYDFCAYLGWIYFRECRLKENFAFYI